MGESCAGSPISPPFPPPNDVAQVRSGLFIGTEHVANDKAVLQALGITHILSMNGCTPKWPEEFQYCTVSAADDDQAILLENMVSGVSFIRDALEMGKSVLVHCRKGVNRSGSMLIGYLMMCENISYNQVLHMGGRQGWCLCVRVCVCACACRRCQQNTTRRCLVERTAVQPPRDCLTNTVVGHSDGFPAPFCSVVSS